jgi:hypothetical protein
MTDEPFGPDRLTTHDLPKARRGYDRGAVEDLLSEAAEAWRRLREEHDALTARIAASGGLEYLQKDLSAIGEEVARILGDAQAAAEGLRERTEAEAVRRTEESTADAAARIEEAEAQSFDLRKSSWETGMRLLDQVREAVAALVADAEQDALTIRAEAEKEGHRRIAGSRKDGDDIIRQARFEADRMIQSAREIAEQLVARARHDSEAGTISSEGLTDEVQRLRAEQSITGVRVLEPDRPESPSSRVDPAEPLSYGELDPGQPGLSEALAEEVSQLRVAPPDPGAAADDEPPAPAGEPAGDEPVAEEGRTEPEPEPDPDDEPGDDAVGSLFDRLRTTAEHEPVAIEDEGGPEADGIAATDGEDPLELRDRLVLPVHNPAVREVRRRLVDLQNDALDAARTGADEVVQGAVLTAEMKAALDPAIAKAATAGADAARRLAGVDAPASISDRPGALLDRMVGALAGQAADAAAGDDPGQAVARVFRQWRNDDAERWTRTVLLAAYHDALLASLAAGGVSGVHGVATNPSCPGCAAAAGGVWAPADPPPDGLAVPPASRECTCTVAPSA